MDWLAQGLPPLDEAALASLRRLTPQKVPAGTALFHPGDTVLGFVIVLSGRIDVFLTGPSGREILLYSVEPGQSCIQSTLGLMGGEEYSGDAQTRSDCQIVLVPKDQFLGLMGTSPEFRNFVFSAFAKRMQTMMHLLEKVAFERVESRLAEMLLERSENNHLRATHSEIAVMIGTAREVVSRRLEALAKRGVLRLDRGEVHLLNRDALKEIAGNIG